MKIKRLFIGLLSVSAIVACQKEHEPTPVFPQPVVIDQHGAVEVPEGFSEWPRTVFVFSKDKCVNKFDVANEREMQVKLEVGAGYQVVVLAYDSAENLGITPVEPGEPAYRYKVSAANMSQTLPRLWYAAKNYDKSADSLKLSFVPITSTLNIEFQTVPEDLDSVSVDLPVSMDSWFPGSQKSEVSIPGSKSKHFVLSREDLQSKVSMGVFAMLNCDATDSTILRCQVPVCFHYRDYRKPGVIPFKTRIGEAQICDVRISDSGEDFLDNDFNLSCTCYDMVGGESRISEQPLSLWPIKKDFEVASDTTFFKMDAGRSFAYQFGSIGSGWCDWKTSFSWGDRTPEIQEYASYGFNFYRIPIDEGYCFFSDGTIKPDFVTELKKIVDASINAGVRVILDLHWLAYSNTFPNSLQEIHYRSCWRQLHEVFKDYDPEWLAYELLNEANGRDGYWNDFIANSVAMIRSWGGNEVRRKIVCSCAPGQSIEGMDTLELPEDPNLIASFHDYSPPFFCFYATGWSPEINYHIYTGPCHYPGRQVTDDELEYMKNFEPSNYACASLYWNAEEWGYAALYDHFLPAYKAKQRLNVPVWVGEYGAYPGIRESNNVVYCRSTSCPATPQGGSDRVAPAGWYNEVPEGPSEQAVWMSKRTFLSSGGSSGRVEDWSAPEIWDGHSAYNITYWATTNSERRQYYKDVCKLFRKFGFSHSYWFNLAKEFEHDEIDMEIVNAVVGKSEEEGVE